MAKQFTCGECGYSEWCFSFKDGIEQGWVFVTLIGHGFGWICPDCALEHQEKIARIQEKHFKSRE